jgi:hypothetical protein
MGWETPRRTEALVGAVRARWPDLPLTLHLHDTRGMAVACAHVALGMGVSSFDASVGGLGGSQDKAGYCKWFMHQMGARFPSHKTHFLGLVSPSAIAATPPTSCDCSSWMGGRFGTLSLYAGRGLFTRLRHGQKLTPKESALMDRYGIAKTDRQNREWWYSKKANKIGAQSYVAFARDVKQRYGTNVVLAVTNTADLQFLVSEIGQ